MTTEEAITKLEYTIAGIMHAVDKWLEDDELKQDAINRAATMREKVLKIVEGLQAENSALHRELAWTQDCVTCAHSGAKGYPAVASFYCEHHRDVCVCGHYVWRGAREAGEDNTK